MRTTARAIGSQQRAALAAEYHHDAAGAQEYDSLEYLAAGSQRTVYLDHHAGIVYKLGDDSANRREVRVLAELRARGVTHAPEATLYEVTLTDQWGDTMTCTVVAMPYLPDDGSMPRPYPLLEGAADLNPYGNVHAHGGQLWLIDAGGL